MVARALGAFPDRFRVADFSGEGGLPLNLELLTRRLARYGPRIRWWSWFPALLAANTFIGAVEDYWERGAGGAPSDTGPLHHNLASWGFEVQDALLIDGDESLVRMQWQQDHWFDQIPESAFYRSARRTLNPSQQPALDTLGQIDIAQRLSDAAGGVETLIFGLGANNALGTALRLDLTWSETEGFDRLPPDRAATLWRPEHFRTLYRKVAEEVTKIPARFVAVTNVPKVTIPPVTRGVNVSRRDRDEQGYFEYYTRFWIWDDDFRRNPASFTYLTRDEIAEIDATVVNYNETIAAVVDEMNAREDVSARWVLVDVASQLDRLAFRRRGGDTTYQWPPELIAALREHPKLEYLAKKHDEGRPPIDTRFLMATKKGEILQGGLIGLDGIHPSTLGYGLMAHEVVTSLNVARSEAGLRPISLAQDWWTDILNADTLLTNPPRNLNYLRNLLGFLAGRRILTSLIPGLAGGL